jgi:hypothetical protein
MPNTNSPHSLNDRNYTITDTASWYRIQKETVLNPGQTSVTLNINSTITGGTTFNIDGVQLEWGSIATPFILLSDPGTFQLTNPNYVSNTMTAAYNEEVISGKSSFIPATSY